MDVQHIFDILIGVIMAGLGFLMKNLHTKTEKTADDLGAFKTHVAENYAHNGRMDEIKQILTSTNNRVDAIYEILTKKAG